MKINLNDFSKPALVNITRAARDKQILPDSVLADLLRMDLAIRCRKIQKKVDRMALVLDAESKKVTLRSPKKKLDAYNKKVDEYNRLIKSGTGLIQKIQALEKAFPEIKPAAQKEG